MHGNREISDVRKFAISEERKAADFSPRIAPSSEFSLLALLSRRKIKRGFAARRKPTGSVESSE